jgi:hypothetical protein
MPFGDLVQLKVNQATAASVAATFDSAITEGNLIVAIVMTGASDITSVSNGTAFTEGIKCLNATEADACGVYWRIATASESTTTTFTPAASDEAAIILHEYEGPWNASPVDQTLDQGRQASGSTYAIASVTTTLADELAIAFCYTRSNDNRWNSTSWDNGFTDSANDNETDEFTTNKSIAMAYKKLTSAGAVGTTTYTLNITSLPAQGGIITFKKSGTDETILIPTGPLR